MHFSIPDTQDLKDESGTVYKAFNIHVNGVIHCVVRYSQMHDLNEQLKREFGSQNLPLFPPKRLLQVKGIDLEERRLQLEKYIQGVSQDPKLSCSNTFITFICRAQQETQREESIPVTLDVFLMNGSKIKVDIQSTDKTDDVLENAMRVLGISSELIYYFGFCLMKNDANGQYSLIRKLQEFECPYISLKCLHRRRLYKIVLRKTYWDQSYDEIVAKDPVGLNLLNTQAESDVKVGWTVCGDDVKTRLEALKGKGSKQEYLRLCQTLKNYGYVRFNPCLSDYPRKGSETEVSAGNYELRFRILNDNESGVKEEAFSVTRMKCWKLSSHFDGKTSSSVDVVDHPLLQLSFEYLVSKGTLRWVTLLSDQAIMMSMCVKSMVDELMRKRRGEKLKTPADKTPSGGVKPTFKARDKTTEALFQAGDLHGDRDVPGAFQKAKDSMKKLSEKLSMVSLLASKTSDAVTENPDLVPPTAMFVQSKTTFEGIGDEDL